MAAKKYEPEKREFVTQYYSEEILIKLCRISLVTGISLGISIMLVIAWLISEGIL